MTKKPDRLAVSLFRSDLLFIPIVTVFISSFCIMILGLVASRMVARQLGSSLYTWTSIIGVVLTGITIGNYCGCSSALGLCSIANIIINKSSPCRFAQIGLLQA